ncbi:ribosome biogenesis GTPase Der [candidate division WWE3 bacterium]|uniref:GTPase Der n=1 Tax=candidate division WWE3 bacterium TaxID=2053526 RepID=A0A928TPU6_UNCKA|nr:ribosome biogenesis GTPase Der [candidate division WWE3 bacterium]
MKQKALKARYPAVAIVGRANVGKSTLWNRIVEKKRALVSAEPHTTRDRNIAKAIWRGCQFEVIDTGGMDTEATEIGEGIRRQAERAMKEADVILFLVDGKTGVVPEDRELAKALRASGNKDIILVINKIEKLSQMGAPVERSVFSLGFGEAVPISAATGKGVGDLLDVVYARLDGKRLEPQEIPEAEEEPLNIVIMGRPNVGKSSLTNAILGEERVIVADIPHTTREPQDTHLLYHGHPVILVDTAGMRRASKLKKELDEEALRRNERALERADIAFLVLDATETPSGQDKQLAGLMRDEHKGMVIVANKWDLVKDKTARSAKEYEKTIRQAFPFLDWAPIVFISAKTGRRTDELLDHAFRIQGERRRVIDYNAANRLLKSVIKQKRPLQTLGPKSPRVHDMAQVSTEPPTFLVTVHGEKERLHPSWLKFVEKRLRQKFGFAGTPIVVKSSNVPLSKSERKWNVRGPGMAHVPNEE